MSITADADFDLARKGLRELAHFVATIRAEERERCARICDDAAEEQSQWLLSMQNLTFTPSVCRKLAELIREQKP